MQNKKHMNRVRNWRKKRERKKMMRGRMEKKKQKERKNKVLQFMLSPQETHLGCISVMLRNITDSTIMLDKMMDKWKICYTFKPDNHSYYDLPQTWVKTPNYKAFNHQLLTI